MQISVPCAGGVRAAQDDTFIVDVASSAFSQCIPNGFADSSLLSRQQLKALSDVCNSEIYRIWYHFRLREGDGSVAPVIIFIVYMGLTSIETVMYYTYILNFHEDGRILDLYRRLIAKEGTLFCPLDVEVSPAELMTILQVCLLCSSSPSSVPLLAP
ncbi:hypothetical protein GUITHDRAFT_103523 [Guillardia theta CCMP2712]|uniref:Uncharacterized protein n=1 Tax=Guillardia theta (strain CCMP2712) TaxID=905079 RepID=L1JR73_GUITC|nr:hypothetical protein GUITHDRAFT_103523 [Guillardia theta CCMP2712]EKX50942.1 hypothetical protein GUITHDRAFT_103523 [Guillardia theta CCMP2712]|eukprot:XP_005837922.1 hypothetical protein GUITHDRAFT_103523 [Guillardia theta CCMP2712]